VCRSDVAVNRYLHQHDALHIQIHPHGYYCHGWFETSWLTILATFVARSGGTEVNLAGKRAPRIRYGIVQPMATMRIRDNLRLTSHAVQDDGKYYEAGIVISSK
jgi:hypothetical protein